MITRTPWFDIDKNGMSRDLLKQAWEEASKLQKKNKIIKNLYPMKKENLFSSIFTILLTPIILVAAILFSPVVKKRKEDLDEQVRLANKGKEEESQ